MAENETGKSKNARYRIEVIGKQLEEVTTQLGNAHSILSKIVNPNQKPTDKAPAPNLNRIEFNCNGTCFYIDFYLVSEDDYLKGAIVYGALRVPRHPYSQWESENFKENRPLFSFSVDEYGKISAKGKLDDEWWLKDGDKEIKKETENAVKEMHYRVLDLVWRDALNWVNEALLP